MIEKEKFLLFLQTIIKKLEQDDLNENETLLLSNFYLQHLKQSIDEDEKANMYLTLGWYIHTFLLK